VKLNGIDHKKIVGPVIFSLCCTCLTLIGVKSAQGDRQGYHTGIVIVV